MRTELLEDGTLIIQTQVDMSKVGRVIVEDVDSHHGEVFYPAEDEE